MKNQKLIQKTYADYYELLFSIAKNQLRNVQHAEDICQEVFIEFIKKFDGISNYKYWLIETLRLKLLSFYREKQGKQSMAVDIDEYQKTLIVNNRNGADNIDLKIILNEVFKDETEQARHIFELKKVYGWTLTHIAEELGLTRRQVRYIYESVARNIVFTLKEKGITSLEDIS